MGYVHAKPLTKHTLPRVNGFTHIQESKVFKCISRGFPDDIGDRVTFIIITCTNVKDKATCLTWLHMFCNIGGMYYIMCFSLLNLKCSCLDLTKDIHGLFSNLTLRLAFLVYDKSPHFLLNQSCLYQALDNCRLIPENSYWRAAERRPGSRRFWHFIYDCRDLREVIIGAVSANPEKINSFNQFHF